MAMEMMITIIDCKHLFQNKPVLLKREMELHCSFNFKLCVLFAVVASATIGI